MSQKQIEILKELSLKMANDEREFIEKQKAEIAKSIAETFLNWKRDVKGMNQAIFAEIIGTSQPRVSNIINGKVDSLTIDKLLGFCSRLKINAHLQSKPLKNIKNETRQMVEALRDRDAA